MHKRYGKLVRDKIPEIIRDDGGVPNIRLMNEEEYRKELLYKLIEEAEECQQAGFDPVDSELVNQLVDVSDILNAIFEEFGITPEYLKEVKDKKYKEQGGFTKKIFLESIQ